MFSSSKVTITMSEEMIIFDIVKGSVHSKTEDFMEKLLGLRSPFLMKLCVGKELKLTRRHKVLSLWWC